MVLRVILTNYLCVFNKTLLQQLFLGAHVEKLQFTVKIIFIEFDTCDV